MYATLGSEQTLLLRKGVLGGDNPRDDPVFSVIQGERLAYASITWPRSTVTVYDRRTKRHSSYFEYDQPSLDVFQLLLSDDYVFWLYPGGTGRAHLATGKVDQFADRLSCWRSAGSWFRFPSIPPSAPSTRVVAACELVRKRTPEVILSRAVHRGLAEAATCFSAAASLRSQPDTKTTNQSANQTCARLEILSLWVVVTHPRTTGRSLLPYSSQGFEWPSHSRQKQ
jgi:hypothetical protein